MGSVVGVPDDEAVGVQDRTTPSWCRCGRRLRHFPNRGLRYPKMAEKLAFQTRAEIERKIKWDDLSPQQQIDLWSCLFLTLPEIDGSLSRLKPQAL